MHCGAVQCKRVVIVHQTTYLIKLYELCTISFSFAHIEILRFNTEPWAYVISWLEILCKLCICICIYMFASIFSDTKFVHLAFVNKRSKKRNRTKSTEKSEDHTVKNHAVEMHRWYRIRCFFYHFAHFQVESINLMVFFFFVVVKLIESKFGELVSFGSAISFCAKKKRIFIWKSLFLSNCECEPH